jgi:hypothetical protein
MVASVTMFSVMYVLRKKKQFSCLAWLHVCYVEVLMRKKKRAYTDYTTECNQTAEL